MKHVLFLPKWYPNRLDPFDGNFVENHAHAIKKIAKVSVLFVHSDDSTKASYDIEERDNLGLKECRVYFKKAKTPISIINKLINLFRYRKAQKLGYHRLFPDTPPSFCHIHVLSRPGLLAMHLKRKLNIPYVITEHWSGYLSHSGEYKGILKQWYTRRLVRKSNGVHAVTTQLSKAMQKHGLNHRYTVIPNVVDVDLFKPNAEKNDDKIQIIFVGNLLQRPKKILDILKGVKALSEQRQDFTLSIYGEGSDELISKQLVSELGIEAFVNFKGTTDRKGIGASMAKSDFLLLFSEFENQPCVIGEAQSCGIPVLVPKLEGIAEFMTEDVGMMIEPFNQRDFVEKLVQMCNLYRQFNGKKIRDYAVKTFGEESIANSFKAFYCSTI